MLINECINDRFVAKTNFHDDVKRNELHSKN